MADTSAVLSNDYPYQYIKLMLENAWAPVAVIVVIWVLSRPQLLQRITSIEVGTFKLQLQALEQQLEATQEQLGRIASRNAELTAVVSEFDANDTLASLKETRAKLKQFGRSAEADDMAHVLEGLRPGASPEQLFAAATILRTRRDPRNFNELVQCLDRIARSGDLEGIRLNTVWYLTSALHLMLVADNQSSTAPILAREQLVAARSMLQRLITNPRVLKDRPDDPRKGVRGPASHAMTWIDRRLAQSNA